MECELSEKMQDILPCCRMHGDTIDTCCLVHIQFSIFIEMILTPLASSYMANSRHSGITNTK
ncbi:MAG: hypothetical protein EA376_05740 [Phycisphaeraceae bacterium]|nr:MAG: hypothetical protein EA376_05740 [Phycisphaeraceae bacterium]